MSAFDNMTLGEIDFIETFTGTPIGKLNDEDRPQAKSLIAMAAVIKKREDPSFTVEDATKLTMTQLQEIIGTDEDDEPGEA